MLMYQLATKNDFDSLDIVLLEEIAEQCPLQGGMAVLQARTMLWPYTGLKYFNTCELEGWEYEGGERRADLSGMGRSSSGSADALIYPNPTDNRLFIELVNCSEAEIELFDISGRSYGKQKIERNGQVELNYLSQGLYLCKITQNQTLIKAVRVIINR